MKKTLPLLCSVCLSFSIVLAPPGSASLIAASEDPNDAETLLQRHGRRNVRVHDPSTIVKCKNEYWFFATGRGINSYRSTDLVQWQRGPRVFDDPPAWVKEVVPTQRGHFWAPDVFLHDGRYLVYYSASKFGANTSAIALGRGRMARRGTGRPRIT